MKILKKIKWFLDNQAKIEALLTEKSTPAPQEKNYSLGGVPDFQKDYVNEILKQVEVEEGNNG